jgi:transcription termination/antitermination protein NusA
MDETPVLMFQRILRVSEDCAREFQTAGYKTLEEIAYVPIEELKQIKKVPEWVLEGIRRRAREYLLRDALGHERGD